MCIQWSINFSYDKHYLNCLITLLDKAVVRTGIINVNIIRQEDTFPTLIINNEVITKGDIVRLGNNLGYLISEVIKGAMTNPKLFLLC